MCYLRIARIVGSGEMRVNFVSLGIAVACSVIVAALVITFGRPVVLTASPSLSAASSTIQPAILTSGDGTVSRKPDLRSEEHTSELQSQSNLVCRLLLEKKKKNKTNYLR